MQGRNLVALAALVLGLGAFIWFVERDLPSTDERREKEKKVLALEEDDVTALEIAFGDRKVRLERVDEEEGDAAKEADEGEDDPFAAATAEWRLVEPVSSRADAAAVSGLVGRLLGLEKERTLEEVDPEAAGLQEPAARVTIETANGAETLFFGGEVPASSDRILGVDGRAERYQVAGGVVDDLTREPGDWRDKALFPGTRSDVQQIRLSGPEGPDVLMARRGDDFWLESPVQDRVDDELANGFLNQVTGLEAEQFLDDGPRVDAFEADGGSIEIVLADREEPFRLELAALESDSGGWTARAGGRQVVEISTDLRSAVERSPEDWRARSLSGIQTFRVDAASFRDAAGETRLRRSDADWLRGEETIPYTVASDLLYAVSDAEATAVRDPGELLDGEPRLTVVLSAEDVEETLRIFPATDDGVPASVSGRDVALLLPAEQVDAIEAALQAVRSAEPVPEETDDGPSPDDAS